MGFPFSDGWVFFVFFCVRAVLQDKDIERSTKGKGSKTRKNRTSKKNR